MHSHYDLSNLKVIAAIIIASKYNTLEGKVQITPALRTKAAVIVARRRERDNKKEKVRVSVFGMTKKILSEK